LEIPLPPFLPQRPNPPIPHPPNQFTLYHPVHPNIRLRPPVELVTPEVGQHVPREIPERGRGGRRRLVQDGRQLAVELTSDVDDGRDRAVGRAPALEVGNEIGAHSASAQSTERTSQMLLRPGPVVELGQGTSRAASSV